MSITIRNTNESLAGRPIETAQEAVSGASVRNAGPATELARGAKDATNLSPLADLLSATTRAAASLQSFRPDLVAAIKAKVSAGTYHADPQAVASRVARVLGTIK